MSTVSPALLPKFAQIFMRVVLNFVYSFFRKSSKHPYANSTKTFQLLAVFISYDLRHKHTYVQTRGHVILPDLPHARHYAAIPGIKLSHLVFGLIPCYLRIRLMVDPCRSFRRVRKTSKSDY